MKNDELFETAVAAVRDEEIDPKALAAATERVRARLAHQAGESAAAPAASAAGASGEDPHTIHGCAGFRALLPAYLAGALAEPKRVLVEDHTRECVGCRRALAELRRGASRPAASAVVSRPTRFNARLALAAGLAGVALLSGALLFRAGAFSPTPTAVVQSIDGELAIVEASGVRPAQAGERFGGGTSARAIRTGGGSGAVVTLADGSKIELAERSELSLGKRWDGTILELARGSVIVEAAEQRRGRLYVETGDCQVAVVGTIFSVNAGAKGSRVSVIEGEVRVRQGAEHAVLRPGDQIATGRFLGAVPVADEIAWSRNAARYRERLAALQALGRELDRTIISEGARTSTRLLDLAPESTSIYVAFPNLTQSLARGWDLVRQRAAENPALAEWWSERFADGEEARIEAAIADLSRFGAELGPEIAVTVELRQNAGAEDDALPLFLATVVDPARFSPILDAEIARLNAEPPAAHGERFALRRIADPSGVAAGENELLVWTTGDLLLASPSADRLAAVAAAVAGSNPFVGTPFHGRLAAVYGDGVDWVLGVDLATVIADEAGDSENPERDARMLARTGFADLESLVIDRRDGEDAGQNRASLTFRGDRRGFASWLASPAPLGALDFVSPSAQVAVAGILKDPAEMLDDVLAIADADTSGEEEGQGPREAIAEVEQRLGISIRHDLAASLGGDFAIALDGPVLPTPAWKIVLEVADAARLHATVQALVEAWNSDSSESGEGETPKPRLRLTQESVDGRILFTLATESDGSGVSRELAHGLFADGYLLLGPSRPLLLEAAAQREAGVRLASSQAFLDLVPRDGQAHFSGLVYQNVAGSLGALASLFQHDEAAGGEGEPDAGENGSVSGLLGEAGPGLAVAYAEGREITFATRGLRGPLGLSFEALLALSELLHPGAAAPEGESAEGSTAAVPDPETRPRQAA